VVLAPADTKKSWHETQNLLIFSGSSNGIVPTTW
jgi:hypothetical protein